MRVYELETLVLATKSNNCSIIVQVPNSPLETTAVVAAKKDFPALAQHMAIHSEEARLKPNYDRIVNYWSSLANSTQALESFKKMRYHFPGKGPPGRPTRALDVGTGDGRFARFLIENGHFDVVFGVDYSCKRIELAHRLTVDKEVKTHITYICQDLYEFLDEAHQRGVGQFDGIFAFDVMEHLEEPDVILRNCRRLLSESGQIVINVPSNMPDRNHLYVYKNTEETRDKLDCEPCIVGAPNINPRGIVSSASFWCNCTLPKQ